MFRRRLGAVLLLLELFTLIFNHEPIISKGNGMLLLTISKLYVNYTITVGSHERLNMTVARSVQVITQVKVPDGKPDYIMIGQEMATELFKALLDPKRDPGRVIFHITRLD